MTDRPTIDQLMSDIGWTTAELARRINSPRHTVYSWRIGQRTAPGWLHDWLVQLRASVVAVPLKLPKNTS